MLTKLQDALACEEDVLHLDIPEHCQWQALKHARNRLPMYYVVVVQILKTLEELTEEAFD